MDVRTVALPFCLLSLHLFTVSWISMSMICLLPSSRCQYFFRSNRWCRYRWSFSVRFTGNKKIFHQIFQLAQKKTFHFSVRNKCKTHFKGFIHQKTTISHSGSQLSQSFFISDDVFVYSVFCTNAWTWTKHSTAAITSCTSNYRIYIVLDILHLSVTLSLLFWWKQFGCKLRDKLLFWRLISLFPKTEQTFSLNSRSFGQKDDNMCAPLSCML